MDKCLTYDNVNLIPRYSELSTRSLADTSVNLYGYKFRLPVIPANMQDVINVDIARYMSNNEFFYIYHRFGQSSGDSRKEDLNTVYFTKLANRENWPIVSISTGVNQDSLKELLTIKALKLKAHFICIDVAHGHHLKVRDRIKWIKDNLPDSRIIVGNIATIEAYRDLVEWGADIVKVGIGQGSICTTRYQTGFSMPMFSCVLNIFKFINNYKIVPIIADGGVKYPGDIPKSLTAGATLVMSGKLFASCINSPAKIIDGHKEYRGSTSFAAKKHNKHIEGKTINIEADVTIEERLIELTEALQSAISYSGGKDLSEFRNINYCIVDNN